MKRIAILSDTHGLLREEVKTLLAEADGILHAGDFDTPAIAQAIRERGNAYLVRGNNDKGWAKDLPQSLRVTIEGVRFFLVHHKRDVPDDLPDVDIVVYGHSHQYREERIGQVLWLNPGSCGARRFHLETTMCILQIDQGRYQVEKILL